MNNLYQQLSSQTTNIPQKAQQMAKMFKGASNPQQLITNMLNSNPQAQQILSTLQQGNISPKDLFYKMAQQKGVNPDLILNMLK